MSIFELRRFLWFKLDAMYFKSSSKEFRLHLKSNLLKSSIIAAKYVKFGWRFQQIYSLKRIYCINSRDDTYWWSKCEGKFIIRLGHKAHEPTTVKTSFLPVFFMIRYFIFMFYFYFSFLPLIMNWVWCNKRVQFTMTTHFNNSKGLWLEFSIETSANYCSPSFWSHYLPIIWKM